MFPDLTYIQGAWDHRCYVTIDILHPRTFTTNKCFPYIFLPLRAILIHTDAGAPRCGLAFRSVTCRSSYLTTLSLLTPDSPPRNLSSSATVFTAKIVTLMSAFMRVRTVMIADARLSALAKLLVQKKVSYRKQIRRQHLCSKSFGQAGGVVEPVKIFLSSIFLSTQSLVAVCHIPYGHM